MILPISTLVAALLLGCGAPFTTAPDAGPSAIYDLDGSGFAVPPGCAITQDADAGHEGCEPIPAATALVVFGLEERAAWACCGGDR